MILPAAVNKIVMRLVPLVGREGCISEGPASEGGKKKGIKKIGKNKKKNYKRMRERESLSGNPLR